MDPLEIRRSYQFDSYRVDPSQGVLMRDGEIIQIGPKPFAILIALLEQHGRVVKKEVIIEKVWQDTHVGESSLTYNVNQLRKALGDNADSPRYVETIRGRGYRFIGKVNEQPNRSRYGARKLYWWLSAAALTAVVGGVLATFLSGRSRETTMVFPQFGRGTLSENTANVSAMKREWIDCDGNCLSDVKRALVIDTVLEQGGYGIVVFARPPGEVSRLGKQLLLRVRITTSEPFFEIGMVAGKTTVHFDCRAKTLNKINDCLISLTPEGFEENSNIQFENIQFDQTQSFSIGFAKDAGSLPGPHRMEVYGVVSGDGFQETSNNCECKYRRP